MNREVVVQGYIFKTKNRRIIQINEMYCPDVCETALKPIIEELKWSKVVKPDEK